MDEVYIHMLQLSQAVFVRAPNQNTGHQILKSSKNET